MTRPAITFAEACRDPNLFGPWFAGETWDTWSVVDKAAFGEPLTDAEMTVFRELTGRDEAPTEPVSELWAICGRRSGKDVKAAAIAVYLATFGAEFSNYRAYLAPGEKAVVQCLAVDRDQAGVVLSYMLAMFEQPIFKAMLKKEPTRDGIALTNGLTIEVTTNDKRRVRGRTVVAAVFDEVAFWASESGSNPDQEVYRAVRPAMATIPGAMLIGITSPYAKRGLAYAKFKAHYGKPGSVLVIKAPTWVMNPTLPRDGDFIAGEYADDPVSASAEFGAEFRSDVEAFVGIEIVEACVSRGVFERAPMPGVVYFAFVDPSGGSVDAMTLAIAHQDGERAVIAATRERKPPFSPDAVVEEFAGLLKSYGISEVTGDRYGGEWPRERFRAHGISYNPAEQSRSDLYRDLLPVLNSGRADLLDSDRLVNQIVGLERRVARGGRESIDHAPGGHDDLANAVAGAVSLALKDLRPPPVWVLTRRNRPQPTERSYIP